MQVQEWLKKLGTVSEIMEQWFQVQNVWTYMEAVFSGGDIVKQLPTEAKRFQGIDKNFMKIVQMAAETGNIVDVCNNIELIKTMLPHLQVMHHPKTRVTGVYDLCLCPEIEQDAHPRQSHFKYVDPLLALLQTLVVCRSSLISARSRCQPTWRPSVESSPVFTLCQIQHCSKFCLLVPILRPLCLISCLVCSIQWQM